MRSCASLGFVGWAGPPAHAVIAEGFDIVPDDLAVNYHRVGKVIQGSALNYELPTLRGGGGS